MRALRPYTPKPQAKQNMFSTKFLSFPQFPAGSSKPDLVLGEAFVPGSDETHFCQPTSIAVSEATGVFFVADGYCNSRVLKYDAKGKLLKIISE